MITSLREKEFQAKQEGNTNESKLSKAASSSRQWSGSRNPRIVRVSRSFGGKDRHSKVCTVRGLRDRRIRLSVPTAIQLYDLQDRLGLAQPSKVIDWLLDVTKQDIDKLPPLQLPQGNFGQFLQPATLVSPDQSNASSHSSLAQFFDANNSQFLKDGIRVNDGEDQTMMGSKPKHSWDFGVVDGDLRAKGKVVGRDSNLAAEKNKWLMKVNEEQENQNLDHGIGSFNAQVSAQNFFPITNQSSVPGYLNNIMPYNPYYQWDPSSLSLSQFGGSHGFSTQSEDPHNSNAHVSVLPSGSQLFFCPPTAATPSLFPTYSPYFATPLESDPRQINHIQLSGSSSQHFPQSFPLNVNPKPLPSQNISGSQPEKEKNVS